MPEPLPFSAALSIVLSEGETPGWRLHTIPVSQEEGIPLTPKQAENIARAMGDAIGLDNAPTPTPFEVVKNGTEKMKSILQQRLNEAEAQAVKVGLYRRSLEELEG